MRNDQIPPHDCPSCGAGDVETDQLCLICRDALRWVVRPEAHRENRRRQLATRPAGVAKDQDDRDLIASFPKDNGQWNCDLCDTTINVSAEFTLIPLLGSYALCPPCAQRIEHWPKGWTQPRPRPCRCRACQTPVAVALTL